MQFDKNDYKTPRTDWALIALATVTVALAGALLYAPPAHWLALLG